MLKINFIITFVCESISKERELLKPLNGVIFADNYKQFSMVVLQGYSQEMIIQFNLEIIHVLKKN